MEKKSNPGLKVLIFALALMLICMAVTVAVDTSMGSVSVKMGKLLSP